MRITNALISTGIAGALLLCSAVPAQAAPVAMANVDSVVNEVIESETPLRDFASLDKAQQGEVFEALEESPALEAQFKRAVIDEYPDMERIAAAKVPYEDILHPLEMAACVIAVDLFSCDIARLQSHDAVNASHKAFPGASEHNGRGDAMRHCMWNGLMYRAIGNAAAVKISGNHEAIWNGPAKEVAMDTTNNGRGRNAGAASTSNKSVENTCKSWAASSAPSKPKSPLIVITY